MGDLDQAAPRGNRAWRPVAIGIDQPLPVGIGVIAKPDPPDRLGHGAPDAAHIAGTGQCRTEVAVEVVRPAQECRPGAVQGVRHVRTRPGGVRCLGQARLGCTGLPETGLRMPAGRVGDRRFLDRVTVVHPEFAR